MHTNLYKDDNGKYYIVRTCFGHLYRIEIDAKMSVADAALYFAINDDKFVKLAKYQKRA